MKNKGPWKKRLNKKERKHLTENKILYKYQLIDQKKFIKNEMKKENTFFVCRDCINILKKLDLWEADLNE